MLGLYSLRRYTVHILSHFIWLATISQVARTQNTRTTTGAGKNKLSKNFNKAVDSIKCQRCYVDITLQTAAETSFVHLFSNIY